MVHVPPTILFLHQTLDVFPLGNREVSACHVGLPARVHRVHNSGFAIWVFYPDSKHHHKQTSKTTNCEELNEHTKTSATHHFSKLPLNSPFCTTIRRWILGPGKKSQTSPLHHFTSMVFPSEGHNHHTLTSLTWKFQRLTQGERGMVVGLIIPAPWNKSKRRRWVQAFFLFLKSDFENSCLFGFKGISSGRFLM